MKGFKGAYKSIFHYYNKHGTHENSFYIWNMHWIYSQSIIYEYLTWLQTGAFTLELYINPIRISCEGNIH